MVSDAVSARCRRQHNEFRPSADSGHPGVLFGQFGVNLKSVGIPSYSDQIVITQGSLAQRRFAAVYGYRGRITAAVTFDHGRWLDFYRRLIESAAVPARVRRARPPRPYEVHPTEVHDPALLSHGPTVAVTGHLPANGTWHSSPRRREEERMAHADLSSGSWSRPAGRTPTRSTTSSARHPSRSRTTESTWSDGTEMSSRCCTTRGSAPTCTAAARGCLVQPRAAGRPEAFIRLDPPEHDRRRRFRLPAPRHGNLSAAGEAASTRRLLPVIPTSRVTSVLGGDRPSPAS